MVFKNHVLFDCFPLWYNCIDKPATEDTLLDPVNPYAETKLMGERMIYWMANRYDWKYVIFRYFNVAGAEMDASNGLRVKNPTHIIPNINKTALGQNDSLKIFGDDYDTRDGSCIRDYIHVLDLAQAHVKGMNYLFKKTVLLKSLTWELKKAIPSKKSLKLLKNY